jgi:hypothetical protein
MWGVQRSQLLRVIIFLGPQCPCVGERKTKRNSSSCPIAPFIESLCPSEYLAVSWDLQGFFLSWQGYLTHPCYPLYFPSSTNQICLCPFWLLCHQCSICWLSRLFLLGLPCSCDRCIAIRILNRPTKTVQLKPGMIIPSSCKI